MNGMAVKNLADCSFDLGPIRPPSEAYSLLIRATKNCPWNRCLFCALYKGQKFELRPAEDIIGDIEKAKAIYDEIKELAWSTGYGDRIRQVAATVYHKYQYDAAVRNVALWVWAGGASAFLQDANTLIMRTPDLVKVIKYLKQTFPGLNRITSYGRSKTAVKKSVEELREMREAGMTRLHIGMESGSDQVLAYVQKGVTFEEHVAGGLRVKEAGISLSEYVMPGLGGRKMSADHLHYTAMALNRIDPDYIRLRSLHIDPSMPLWSRIESGDFELQTEDEVVEELYGFIEKLEVTSWVKSDHIMNLLPEINGKFPKAKSKCLEVIKKYLSLPSQERLNYRLGRRAGCYEKIDDIYNIQKRQKVDEIIRKVSLESGRSIDEVITMLKTGFI